MSRVERRSAATVFAADFAARRLCESLGPWLGKPITGPALEPSQSLQSLQVTDLPFSSAAMAGQTIPVAPFGVVNLP